MSYRPRHARLSGWHHLHVLAVLAVLVLAPARPSPVAAKYDQMQARRPAPRVVVPQGGPRPAEALQRAVAWQTHLDQVQRAREAARKAEAREAAKRRAAARARERQRREAAIHASASARVLARARQLLGIPYVWGGASAAGLDCSGFTLLAYAAVGLRLPHSSGAQRLQGHLVARPRRGDLVWWPGHVAVYQGGGLVMGARHAGTLSQVYPLYGTPEFRRLL